MIMKYTKYPNAAKEFLRFMMEKEQFDPWLTASGAYIATPLAGYASAADLDRRSEEHAVSRPGQEPAAGGLRGQAGVRVGRCGGGLHRRQHGGRGDQRLEDAEGGDGAGPEARRTLLPRLTSAVAAASRGHGVANAAFVRGITLASLACPSTQARLASASHCHLSSMTFLERLQNNRNALGLLFMLPAAVLLLLFLTYPLGLGLLARLHRRQGRPHGRVGRARELRVPVGRRGHAAGPLQHPLLYLRRERHQVRARALAGAAAQSQHPRQDLLPRRHPAALHRADGALGDRLLVDLRRPVLDHQLDRWSSSA